MDIFCSNCRRPYPVEGVPYKCPTCGGVYNVEDSFEYLDSRLDGDLPGIWRYRHTFPLSKHAPVISLGEGNTPVEWREISGRQVAFKLEQLNPTGSFKDRGSAVLSSFLVSRGVKSVVEDSSGNAGASFAAYAAEAGIKARIFVPDDTTRSKLEKIESYDAKLVRIMGPRSNAAQAVLREVDQGSVYASHAYLPAVLAGYATVAYEIVGQNKIKPGTVVIPAGHGNLLLGVMLGFRALFAAGIIEKIPVPVGVQALACAPIWAVFHYGAAGMGWVSEAPTVAEGVRVRYPARGDLVIRTVTEHEGTFLAVEEEDILSGRDQLSNLGFSIEPSSALVWKAIEELLGSTPEPVLAILTGAGHLSS